MSGAGNLPSVLQRIIERKHEEVAQRQKHLSARELRQRIADCGPPRGFLSALQQRVAQGLPAIIAEIKKASPSAGVIRADFDPVWIAERYQAHGATCLSVLTDHDFFQGHEDYLQQARAACSLPVIRKDFVVDPWQVLESRYLGADAVLLIMAALDDAMYQELYQTAQQAGLDVLVEVHNTNELQRALAIAPPLIGINNRDLHQFKTDLATSEALVPQIPVTSLVVGESGIHQHADILRLQRAGIHCFLVGEALMRAPDPGQALRKLLQTSDAIAV